MSARGNRGATWGGDQPTGRFTAWFPEAPE